MTVTRRAVCLILWTCVVLLHTAEHARSTAAATATTTQAAHHHRERHDKHVRHGSRKHAKTTPGASPPTHDVTQGNGGGSQSEVGDNTRPIAILSDIIRYQVKEQNPSEILNASNLLKWDKELYEYEDNSEAAYEYSDSVNGDIELVSDQEYYQADSGTESTVKDVVTTESGVTQDVWKERMRAKHMRMFIIQADIMRVLGLKKQPNVSGIHISNQDGFAIKKYMNPASNEEMSDTVNAHRYEFASPSCDLPPKTGQAWWDPKYFRLYFIPEKPKNHPLADFDMSSASLRLYKQGPVEKECDCKNKKHLGKHENVNGDVNVPRRNGRKGVPRRPGGGSSSRDRSRRKAERAAKKKKNSSKHNLKSSKNHKQASVGYRKTKDQLRITVYWFQKPVKATKKNRKVKKQLMTSRMVDRDYIGWVEIDIKQYVERWIRRPRKNYGIEIYVEDDDQVALDPYEVFDSVNCSRNSNQDSVYLNLESIEEGQILNEAAYEGAINLTLPNLEIVHIEIPVKAERRKRQVSQTCVKENTFISFSDLGLEDWILAPQGLETVYCKGHCRYDVVPDLAHKNDANKKCCGPTKFKPFRFLHYGDNGKLSVSSVDNLIVSECGCRE